MIISRTPFRISFFGGGTDYPLWYQQHGGTVLATTIDKYCYISCRYLPPFFSHNYRVVYSKVESVVDIEDLDHPSVKAVLKYLQCYQGLEIHHDGDLPARSGLGSSSSFTVGLLNAIYALQGSQIPSEKLAYEAIHIEQEIIQEHVGSQDQISASFGGFNQITFFPNNKFRVNPIILSDKRLEFLQEHLMLFFTGISRFSSKIAKSQLDNFKHREKNLHAMGQMVQSAIDILCSNTPILEFGNLLNEAWKHKRSLSDQVSNQKIDQAYDLAKKNGAIGGKILGAGGGGFLLLFAEPQYHQKIRQRLKDLVFVPFSFETSGSQIVLYQPNGLGNATSPKNRDRYVQI